jgi:hypothetical protein
MCWYDDQDWTCVLCGAFQHGPSPCRECGGDERRAKKIRRGREANLAPIPCDTHNQPAGWICELCGTHNPNPENIVCWQCGNDPQRAIEVRKKKSKKGTDHPPVPGEPLH